MLRTPKKNESQVRDSAGRFSSSRNGLSPKFGVNWKISLPFVIVFAIIGGFMVLRSFAFNSSFGSEPVLSNGIYSWWIQPLAVNDRDYVWIGSIARLGTVRVTRVDTKTKSVQTIKLDKMNIDDHNGPAIAYASHQPNLLIFYTNHAKDNIMRYRTVNRETMKIGEQKQLKFSKPITYAQVLRHNNTLVLFTRIGSSKWGYRISKDYGKTWGTEKIFIDATGYGQVYSLTKPFTGDSNTNFFAFYGHPTNSTYHKIDFGIIKLDTGSVIIGNGKIVGNIYKGTGPAFRPGKLDTVASSNNSKDTFRLLDIGELNNLPAVAFAKWNPDRDKDPANSDQINAQYKVKTRLGAVKSSKNVWTGGSWGTVDWNLRAGQKFGYKDDTQYIGGVVFGRNNRLFSSRYDTVSGKWIPEEWQYNSLSNRMTLATELGKSSLPVTRPYRPARNGKGEVIYQELLKYNSYTDYDSNLWLMAR